MKSVLLVVLTSLTHAQLMDFCPASCVVCSEDATICQKLANVISIPVTTKALIFTNGYINSLRDASFSHLSNMTLLGLSNNVIANIEENAFHNLTSLKTLLLDHNQITSTAILDSTFTQLRSLETLQLGSNALQNINGSWFKDMTSLLTLQLEGNQITKLDSNTFTDSNLQNLKCLDLSNNLISYLGKDSFSSLPRLYSLDLSKNSLSIIPDAFSYLSWLSVLNLDMNHWNCTCELQELSAFLRRFIKNQNQVLLNGKKLVCENTKNPAIQTVLQLTESNCVPPNQNITIVIKNKDYKHYVRDVVLAAIFCFAGAVGLTLAGLFFFYNKLLQSKGQRCWKERPCPLHGEDGTYNAPRMRNHASSRRTPDCIFTEDNEVQVLSIVHPRNKPQLKQENTVAAMARTDYYRSRKSDEPARNVFACLNCRLVQSVSERTPGKKKADNKGCDDLKNLSQVTINLSEQRGLAQREETQRYLQHPASNNNEDARNESQHKRRHAGHNPGQCQDQITHIFEKAGKQGHYCSGAKGNKPTQYNTMHSRLGTCCMQRGHHGNRSIQEGHPENIHSLPDYLTINCVHCHTTYEYRREGSEDNNIKTELAEEKTKELVHRNEALLIRKTTLHRDYIEKTPIGPPKNKLAQIQKTVSFKLPDNIMSNVRFISRKEIAALRKHKRKSSHKHNNAEVESIQYTRPTDEDKEGTVSSIKRASKNGKAGSSKEDKQTRIQSKHKTQSSGLLKVKISLDPFWKNTVHPSRKGSIEDVEKQQVHRKPERTIALKKKSKTMKSIEKKDPIEVATPEVEHASKKKSKAHKAQETKKQEDQLSQDNKMLPGIDATPNQTIGTRRDPEQGSLHLDRSSSSAEKEPDNATPLQAQHDVTASTPQEKDKDVSDPGKPSILNMPEEDRPNESQGSTSEVVKVKKGKDQNTREESHVKNNETLPVTALTESALETETSTDRNVEPHSDIVEPKEQDTTFPNLGTLKTNETGADEGSEIQNGKESQVLNSGALQVQEQSESQKFSVPAFENPHQDPTINQSKNRTSLAAAPNEEIPGSDSLLEISNYETHDDILKGGSDVRNIISQSQSINKIEDPEVEGPVASEFHEGMIPQNQMTDSTNTTSDNALPNSESSLDGAKSETINSTSHAEAAPSGENHSNNNSTHSSLSLTQKEDDKGPVAVDNQIANVLLSNLEPDKYTGKAAATSLSILQEIEVPSGEGTQKKKICLVLPEQSSNRLQSALNKKIR
ncbi:leucine-rich repeat-containing protein 53 isoform X2 [Acipenser ruthenus]|uniref:leucine-rich repeat-containing protein 53 isoform X2 n=1 Tax=Acipenser ruthenus TaxID=7906 RepID=UPI0027414BD1|nr:leucine-rich repeat-containing protein 53 isoform X2 [Acipenser ruthenus]